MNYLALTAGELDGLSSNIGLTFATGKIGDVVGATLPYFFGIAGFALAIYIVLAGFALMTSKGDDRLVAAAKAKLTYGITGFLIVFAAYWIVQVVGAILGIEAINLIF